MDYCQASLQKNFANVRSSWDVSNFGPVWAFSRTCLAGLFRRPCLKIYLFLHVSKQWDLYSTVQYRVCSSKNDIE